MRHRQCVHATSDSNHEILPNNGSRFVSPTLSCMKTPSSIHPTGAQQTEKEKPIAKISRFGLRWHRGNPCSDGCGCTKATPENFLRAFLLTWCHFFLLFPARPACSVPRHKQCFLDFVTVRRTSPPACYHSLSTQEPSNLKITGQGEKSLVHFLSVNATSHIPRNPCCVPRNDFVHVRSQRALRSEGPMRTGIPIPTRRSSRQSWGGAKSPLVFRCLAARNIEPAGSHDVAAGRSPGFSHRSGNVVPLCWQLISRLLLLDILIWSLLPGSNTDLRTHIVYQADSGTDFSSRGKAESPALFADLTK
ncbi:hypothetical protein EDB80DRAFT_371110 [Ilyonectria destructans]|nr:hypothetical protein EDB80DRAFT_371110 [Ilyonectria destructans]